VPATVVVLTKLPGCLPVKTRLAGRLGVGGARDAYERMLADTLDLARRFDPEPVVAYSPPHADPRAALPWVRGVRFAPVEGDDGATCLENALRDAYRRRPLVALGGDAPDLPASHVADALRRLDEADVVVVPTGDGGFSCLVLRRPVEGLAVGLAYGAPDALEGLAGFLEARGLGVARTEPWPDIDTPEHFEAWQARRAL
jgi:glycosyltransferase A (GT-A) superfamily protein (DUF2064 family)